MTEADRIMRLEQRMDTLDAAVEELKKNQADSAKNIHTAELDFVKLNGTLSALSTNLKDHMDYHKEQGEKKYKVTDVILAVGMLLLGIMEFVDRQQPNQIAYKSPTAVERVVEK